MGLGKTLNERSSAMVVLGNDKQVAKGLITCIAFWMTELYLEKWRAHAYSDYSWDGWNCFRVFPRYWANRYLD